MHEEYSNPTIPEGINAPQRHQPLRTFFVLGATALAIFALCLFCIGVAATLLAPHIPFSWGQQLMGSRFALLSSACTSPRAKAREEELRRLAGKISTAMQLPVGMDIAVHYNVSDVDNAAAFPGGHIVVFHGILEKMHSEDELAALLAHEIAHVQHRDVARGMVRAIGATLLMANVESIGALMGMTAQLSMLSYTRSQEAAADRAAAAALAQLYGHTGGALRLFEGLQQREGGGHEALPEIMSSHPDFESRMASIREHSRALGVPDNGAAPPLPEVFRTTEEEKASKKQGDGCGRDEASQQRE